ncbi:acyl dehydratase [Arthrobacter sp. SLBN-100]|uniref:MaoC family dehydratase n=1 Tax=Arthrobacter sp. SLBN-100 TaxID=2768450 RepID=UPI00116B9591|nr:MaoC family dehydratase [Arthrobacter sp. SLBN-100]TQJ61966.1 acyl dehydratase [Arthrobacter sp. SLBN-100]
MTKFRNLEELLAAAGSDLGSSRTIILDQPRVDTFADITEDRQWIHTDQERAAEGPFGTTIAHGFYTLSLVAPFLEDLLEVEGVSSAVNYGLNKVRFPSAVPTGSELSAKGTLGSVAATTAGAEATVNVIIERTGGTKPVCVAEVIIRYFH